MPTNHPARRLYLSNETYVAEGVWQKTEVEKLNVVLINGGRAQ